MRHPRAPRKGWPLKVQAAPSPVLTLLGERNCATARMEGVAQFTHQNNLPIFSQK
jgi:hypothetical protein